MIHDSHSLNNDSPYRAGIPKGSVELDTICFDWGNPMLDCLIQTFKFPGWSMDALKYIYEVRNAATNGHETLDTDASVLACEAGNLACEHYVLGKGKLQVEVLCNLEKIAPAGAVVMVSYPRIEGATGLPARV